MGNMWRKNRILEIISTSKGRTGVRGSEKVFQMSKNAIPRDSETT